MSNTVMLVILVAIVFLILSVFITLFVIIYQRRQLNFRKTTEQLKVSFNQELLQTQLEIQEQTFQNISLEIHDNLGQALSFIKLNINTINIDEQDAAKDKLSESKTLLTKVIQDMRDLSKTLNTDFINEIGLAKAIEQQINILQKSGVYTTDLNITGEPEKYKLQIELVVFRIVQELLNNIVKHAEANLVNVVMNYYQDRLLITVTDNGKGFDTDNISTGLGLRNMHNRLRLINGTITLNSEVGKGTSATINLSKQNG